MYSEDCLLTYQPELLVHLEGLLSQVVKGKKQVRLLSKEGEDNSQI